MRTLAELRSDLESVLNTISVGSEAQTHCLQSLAIQVKNALGMERMSIAATVRDGRTPLSFDTSEGLNDLKHEVTEALLAV